MQYFEWKVGVDGRLYTEKTLTKHMTFYTMMIDDNPGFSRGQSTYDIEGKRCTIYGYNCSPVQIDCYFIPGLNYLLHI